MIDTEHLIQFVYGFFCLLGITGIVAAFKTIDWLISQKYVSHTKCEKCRGEVYKTIAIDHDLLQKVDGKMDIMLECMGIHDKN